MDTIIVKGGHRLSGRVKVEGAKCCIAYHDSIIVSV